MPSGNDGCDGNSFPAVKGSILLSNEKMIYSTATGGSMGEKCAGFNSVQVGQLPLVRMMSRYCTDATELLVSFLSIY